MEARTSGIRNELFPKWKFIVLWCPGGDSRPYSSPKMMAKDNKERIHYIRKKSKTGDFVEVCSDMNIISNLPEYIKPKNVGLMFFCMEPDKFFPYTQIDVVQFPDGLGGDHIIEQTFKGPIHQQLREALQ